MDDWLVSNGKVSVANSSSEEIKWNQFAFKNLALIIIAPKFDIVLQFKTIYNTKGVCVLSYGVSLHAWWIHFWFSFRLCFSV